jgi:hypothetical protein
MKIFLLILIAVLFLASCTVEKRLYTGGYHVSFNRSFGQLKAKNSSAEQANTSYELRSKKGESSEFDLVLEEQVSEEIYVSKPVSNLVEEKMNDLTADFDVSVQLQVVAPIDHTLQEERDDFSTVSQGSYYRKSDQSVKKAALRSHADFWETFWEIVFWLVLIGLVVLGVIYPVIGTILMITAVVLLVLLVLVIIAFFVELFEGIFDLLS